MTLAHLHRRRPVWLAAWLVAITACGAELRSESARGRVTPGGGLSAEAVHEVERAHVPTVRACYEQFAKSEGRPMGVVRFTFRIEPAGTATGVLVLATTLHSTSIEGCIADEIARWRFPAAPRETEVDELPFSF